MGCLERGLLAWGRQAVAISLIDHNDVLVILFPLGGIAYIKLAASFILPPPTPFEEALSYSKRPQTNRALARGLTFGTRPGSYRPDSENKLLLS